ncbi:unnamed protein product, partial [Discosporangium mesarthrocarpum]
MKISAKVSLALQAPQISLGQDDPQDESWALAANKSSVVLQSRNLMWLRATGSPPISVDRQGSEEEGDRASVVLETPGGKIELGENSMRLSVMGKRNGARVKSSPIKGTTGA